MAQPSASDCLTFGCVSVRNMSSSGPAAPLCRRSSSRLPTAINCPSVNDADAVGHFLGHAQFVRGQQHGHALARTFLQHVLHHPRMLRIKTDHGLVNHKHLRVVQQRGHDGHPLARAVRKAFERAVREIIQMKARDQFLRVRLDPGVVHLKQLAGEAEKFPRRQLVVEKGKIGDVSQCAAALRAVAIARQNRIPARRRRWASSGRREFSAWWFSRRRSAPASQKIRRAAR